MINAVFYSDQIIPANEKVDIRLAEMMSERGRRIGYIPSGPDPQLRFYSEKRAYYARQGLALDIYFDLNGAHGSVELNSLFDCDAIHLSGGSTVAFLARLRQSGLLDRLRNWANDGGLLIGTSAGAILMTPTIAVDALFGNKRPEDVKEGAALDLVPFEFFPHLQAKASYLPDLLAYSTRNSRPIIACPDGDGVVVAHDVVESVGNPLWISNGSIERKREMTLAAFGH